MARKKRKRQTVRELWRANKKALAIRSVMEIFVVVIMILQIFNRDYHNVFLCILTLFLFAMPAFISRKAKIEIPNVLEIIILVFIFAAEILGEIGAFYMKIKIWDTMLHTVSGFLMAAIGFSIVDILNRHESIRFSLSPFFVCITAICFAMTLGVFWEFIEFSADKFLGLDMQKDWIVNTIRTVMLDPTNSNKVIVIDNITDVVVNGQPLGLGGYLDIGLIDTMKDLFVTLVGAVIFAFFGFFYEKKHGDTWARNLIPVTTPDDEVKGLDKTLEAQQKD